MSEINQHITLARLSKLILSYLTSLRPPFLFCFFVLTSDMMGRGTGTGPETRYLLDVFKETDDGDYDTGCKIISMLNALELNGEVINDIKCAVATHEACMEAHAAARPAAARN